MGRTKQDLQVVASMISAMLNERPAPVGIAAHVVPGSYTPEDGTVVASIDDTDAAYQLAVALGDDPITVLLSRPRVPIETHDPNDQYGPRGTEPVMLHPTQRGYVARFIADADGPVAPGAGPYYSVGAPAGERWIAHRNANGDIDAFLKHTNDGPTDGDGLGGAQYGGDAALTQFTTKGGFVVAANDTAKTATLTSPTGHVVTLDDNPATSGVKVQTAGGLIGHFDDVLQEIAHIGAGTLGSPTVYTLVNGAGQAISHVVGAGGTLALGALASHANMSPAIAVTDTTALISDSSVGINIQRWVDLIFTMKALLIAMTTSGVPSLPTLAALITEMSSVFGTTVPSFGSLPGWSAIIPPAGSSVVSLLHP